MKFGFVLVFISLNLLCVSVMGQGGENPFGLAASDPTSLKGEIYFLSDGTSSLPDFSSLTPDGIIYTKALDIPARSFTSGFPGITNRFEWFAIRYTGTFNVDKEGDYAFRLVSDDGSRLFIDGKKIIDNDGLHQTQSASGNAYLTRGQHSIEVDYFQGPREVIALQLFWTQPGRSEEISEPTYVPRPPEGGVGTGSSQGTGFTQGAKPSQNTGVATPMSSNAAQYCPAECKARNAIWNGKDEYPYCNCVCEKGYEFDSNGLNCVPITSESGTNGESSGLIEVVTMQGTTSAKPGDKTQVTLPSGGQAEIRAKCDNLAAKLALIRLAYSDFNYLDVGVQFHILSLQVAMKNLGCSELLRENSEKPGENYLGKVADFGGVPTSSSASAPVEMKIELQQGPLRVEVVNDQVSLDVDTPTTIVSSEGRNTFGVAYDPNSGTSFVTAYQNPLIVQPINQAPFTLGSGQQVEVSSSGIGPITTVGQTTGGSTYVSPDGKDIYGPVGETQGGCRTDPATGQTICVETVSDFSNPSGVSSTDQSETSISIPNSLQECETYTSEICGTWTMQGSQINAVWDNGAEATLNVEQFDNNAVVITRQDTTGSSAGLTARYEGRLIGNHVEGNVKWNWNGSTWSGTWTADW